MTIETFPLVSLPSAALMPRIAWIGAQDRAHESRVGNRSADRDRAVGGGGEGVAMRRSDPFGGERDEREPEEQEQVRPHHGPGDALGEPQQVMVVVPVDPDHREAQDVDEQRGKPALEPVEIGVSGVLRPSTMIVMITAITPSVKASSRCESMRSPLMLRESVIGSGETSLNDAKLLG